MKNGSIEVIVGSMFSGKSEELIRRAKRVQYAKIGLLVFNHCSDTRYKENSVVSHNQNFIEAIPLENIDEIFVELKMAEEKGEKIQVICIDEAQFFGDKLVAVCEALADIGKRVIVAGLDMDFRGEPFSPMDKLLARAEKVDKFNAVCVCCGETASRTQRLVDGKPAKYDDEIVKIGASESYEPRCRKCHIVIRDF